MLQGQPCLRQMRVHWEEVEGVDQVGVQQVRPDHAAHKHIFTLLAERVLRVERRPIGKKALFWCVNVMITIYMFSVDMLMLAFNNLL